MSQTRERRIYLMWKARRKDADWYRRGEGPGPLLSIARAFKIPIREVREIINAQRPPRDNGRPIMPKR